MDTTWIPLDSFREILYLSIFRSSEEEIQISLKPDKNNGHFMLSPVYIFDQISSSFSWNENILDKFIEKTGTDILWSINFSFENRAVYGVIWKNVAVRGKPQMTIWRMRVACWIPKARNKNSEYALHTNN